jgi:hypothetical protein
VGCRSTGRNADTDEVALTAICSSSIK